jgi:hypothetical protein
MLHVMEYFGPRPAALEEITKSHCLLHNCNALVRAHIGRFVPYYYFLIRPRREGMSPVGHTFWMGYGCEDIWSFGVGEVEESDIPLGGIQVPVWGKPKDMYRSHFVFRKEFLGLWDS